MSTGRNRLGEEKSPYLLQHKDNPVWWQPWGAAALDDARRRGVPVFLSIGYSTCHWCHVMEHESFEDSEVADALNEGFVAIKVDREERPDVDARYMQAVQAMTGRGGWPMSVFLTPEGRPFFGGTYFPKEQFLSILEQLGAMWRSDRERIEGAGADLALALARASASDRAGELDASRLAAFLTQWRGMSDRELGGRRGAPKFPPAYDLQLLLRIHRRSGDAGALEIVTRTLDAMAAGGIYDHVGGGFHRYSTDEMWLVPHFEKMLYDQAALAGAYLDAFQATGVREYELVAREILDYILREMTHPEGGFYSAEDADSEGEEGKFYVWSAAELRGALTPGEFDELAGAFSVSERGNFEHGTNVLSLRPGRRRSERSPALAGALVKLRELRGRRIRPHLDDKILGDWNGLMMSALARAGRVLDEPRYTRAAGRAAAFVLARLRGADGRLMHRWRDGEAAIGGFLDDYAFVVHGLIEMHQADFDALWLDAAVGLQRRQDELFWDEERGDYFFTDGVDAAVLGRGVEAWDNVTPAGRSVAALNLLRLAALTGETSFADRAARVFASTPRTLHSAPTGFSFLLAALDHALDRSKEVAIVGSRDSADTRAMLAAMTSQYQPNQVVVAGPPSADDRAPFLLRDRPMKDGRATAYVCEHGICSRPTTDPREAAKLAATSRRLSPD